MIEKIRGYRTIGCLLLSALLSIGQHRGWFHGVVDAGAVWDAGIDVAAALVAAAGVWFRLKGQAGPLAKAEP